MSVRKATAAFVAVCAMALLAPMSALAAPASRAHARSATAVTSLAKIPMTGKAGNHKTFNGTFTVQRFTSKNGQSYAVGTLTGKIGNRTVHRNNVAIPAAIGTSSGGAHDAATTGCPVLHLDLGPLNLNLLGLQVHLNRVVLDITAVPGAGNLLGNLLCDVANLLNGSGLPLGQVTGLLNILNTVLSNPGLLNL